MISASLRACTSAAPPAPNGLTRSTCFAGQASFDEPDAIPPANKVIMKNREKNVQWVCKILLFLDMVLFLSFYFLVDF
jgi:hypothetical protein